MARRYKKPNMITAGYKNGRYGSVFTNLVMIITATILGGVVCYAFYYVSSGMPASGEPAFERLLNFVYLGVAGFVGLTLLLPMSIGWVVRLLRARRDKKILDQYQKGGSTESVGWYDFERLCKGLLEKHGYQVKHKGGSGGDGGIDLIATRNGVSTLVQCKHWKARRVGVGVVREMVGAAIHYGYPEVMVITSGGYTKDAMEFAKGKKIQLIDGTKLRSAVSLY